METGGKLSQHAKNQAEFVIHPFLPRCSLARSPRHNLARKKRWEAFRDRHGDWGRDLALWLARQTTGMTLGQIGKHAGGLDYATVGMALRYLEARCQHDKKLLRLREKLKNDLLT